MDSNTKHAHAHDLSHTTWQHVWDRQAMRGELADDYWRIGGAAAGARVLEVGCGPGYFSLAYARLAGPGGCVVAVDIAPEAIAFLAARDEADTVDARVTSGDASKLPPGPFDITFVTDVLHHADDPASMLRELRTRTASLVIAEFAPGGDPEYGPPAEHRLPQQRIVAWLEAAGWRIRGETDLRWDHYAIVADVAN